MDRSNVLQHRFAQRPDNDSAPDTAYISATRRVQAEADGVQRAAVPADPALPPLPARDVYTAVTFAQQPTATTGEKALSMLKTPLGQVGLCAVSGTAFIYRARQAIEAAGVATMTTQAVHTVLVSCAAVAAASLHGRIASGESRSNQNLVLGRALLGGAALGLVLHDVRMAAQTPVLMPHALQSPAVALPLLSLMASALGSQTGTPGVALQSGSSAAIWAQALSLYELGTATQSFVSALFDNISRTPPSVEQLHAEWQALVRSPLGFVSVSAAIAAATFTCLPPSSSQQRSTFAMAAAVLVVACNGAVMMQARLTPADSPSPSSTEFLAFGA